MNLLMIFAAVIAGRITQWQHYTHFGGVNDVIVENSTVISASTGGVAFGTLEGGGVSWDSTWTCPGELSISDARCLARDGSGNLWVGTYGGGIDVELASGGFQHYGQLEGLPISMKVNCILPDSIIWAGTTEGLCSKELGYFEVWTVFSTGGGLPSDIVNCVAPCDSGLFVGTSSGLAMLRSAGSPGDPSSWISYPSLESISIQDIIVGPDTSWAATGEGLFYMAPGGTWQRTADYPGDQPVSLALDQGRLAVGGNGEAAVRTASGWDYDQGLGTQVVRSICWLDDQSLLMGQYDDFSVDRSSGSGVGIGYPGGWISSMPQGTPTNDLRCVDVDIRGDVWVTGNRRGAAVLSGGSWTHFLASLPSSTQIFACLADNSGGVFIAPWHTGVTWLDWKGTADKDDDVLITFNTSNSAILNDQIREMALAPDGGIWMAQEAFFQTPSEPSGVSRLSWNPGNEVTASWDTFTPSDGLLSGDVRTVAATSDPSEAWMGTQEGLALGNAVTGNLISSYTAGEGLQSNDVQALAVSRTGDVYAGTTGGLAMIRPGSGNVMEVEGITGNIGMLCFDNLSCLWVASSEGLYRIYPDGETEEYNTFNSPLQSLEIRYAACDHDRGLLYIITDHGLWKLTLEQGMDGDLQSAAVYPNPFLPGAGQIMGVAGLPDIPMDIRIFDLSGQLVYESLDQERDAFSWTGTDNDGSDVPSGTYIVQVTQDGVHGFIKLAVVR